MSRDLVHWQHLPVAIAEEKDTMIFSRSFVTDPANTAGFARQQGQVPMIAVYTGYDGAIVSGFITNRPSPLHR